MSYTERTNQKTHNTYGGWTMTWERLIEGRWYKFTRAYMTGNQPYVYIAAYRYDNKGTWVQTHTYQLEA